MCYAGLLNAAILLLYYVCSNIFRGQTTAQVIIPLLALACYCGTGFCAGLQPIDNSQSPQHIYSACAEVHVPNTACNRYLCEVYQGFPSTEKYRKLLQLHQARLRWQHTSEALQWWALQATEHLICIISLRGTPFSSTSLPNFTGNPFLLLILFFFLQKNFIRNN